MGHPWLPAGSLFVLAFESNNVSMQPELLPLFPLQMVLLPGARVPLHIFEERYKEMIGEALRQESEFGIVLATGDGIHKAGCSAVVDRVLKEYDDGRLDIMVAGRRRFEILSLDKGLSLLRGWVEFFDDEDGTEPDAGLRSRVESGLEQLRQAEGEADEPVQPDVPLSFRATHLIRDLGFRQAMLGARSERERLRRLAEFLPAALEETKRIARARALSGQNGHAKHFQP